MKLDKYVAYASGWTGFLCLFMVILVVVWFLAKTFRERVINIFDIIFKIVPIAIIVCFICCIVASGSSVALALGRKDDGSDKGVKGEVDEVDAGVEEESESKGKGEVVEKKAKK